MSKMVEEIKIFGQATDPIYIGTGGYTIGRVDNTIVRDPLNRVPKIPGSSLAGTWRFYSSLHVQGKWADIDHCWSNLKQDESIKRFITFYSDQLEKQGMDIKDKKNFIKRLEESDFRKLILRLRNVYWDNEKKDWHEFWTDFWGKFEKFKEEIVQDKNTKQIVDQLYANQAIIKHSIYSTIHCAGQDELPNQEIKEGEEETIKGHCGRCIICTSFGYSKNTHSWQGILFFSDLEIILFPVYTQYGTKWITTEEKLNHVIDHVRDHIKGDKWGYRYDESEKDFINLGWLNIKVKPSHRANGTYIIEEDLLQDNGSNQGGQKNDGERDQLTIDAKDIVVVSDKVFNQVVNANLEVRTSVSIDPLTGTARDGHLFTSEAIPRGTIFYGNIRVFDKSIFTRGLFPDIQMVEHLLLNSKSYFETLGIGGLTTRGFGRMKVILNRQKIRFNEGDIGV